MRGASPKERSRNVFRGREKARRESFYRSHTRVASSVES